jgi:lactoylglutathione lyase
MRTLHIGLQVEDLERSLEFYENLGYEVVGTVPATEFGDLTMLKLPDDDVVPSGIDPVCRRHRR